MLETSWRFKRPSVKELSGNVERHVIQQDCKACSDGKLNEVPLTPVLLLVWEVLLCCSLGFEVELYPLARLKNRKAFLVSCLALEKAGVRV